MRNRTSLGIVIGVIILSLFSYTSDSHAVSNPDIGNQRAFPWSYIRGSNYWSTSSIREWLNSDKPAGQVIYTNEPPNEATLGSQAYADEQGFLNDFTASERQGIAVTTRRAFVWRSNARDGGSSTPPRYDGLVPSDNIHISSPDIDKVWRNLMYQTVHEKVFLLGTHEMFEYVQMRGFETKKGLTESAKRTFNIGASSYTYATSTPNYSNTNGEAIWGYNTNGHGTVIQTSTPFGIAPALHLKPTYRLSNGQFARDLDIGDVVSFGRHLGETIQWRVINQTPEGYPLLWAEKSVTIKRFDAPGDKHLRDSIGIPYTQGDISIHDDLKFTNGTSDTTPPSLRVVDDTELTIKQSEPYRLTIEAVDSESGIRGIILPNGNMVMSDRVNYTFGQNGRYYFTAVDKVGNHYGFEIPVGNISPKPYIVTEQTGGTWTNQDVHVSFKSSESNTDWEMAGPRIGKPSIRGPWFSNYTSYAGRTYRLSGEVRLKTKKDDRFSAIVRLIYRVAIPFGDNYRVSYTYPGPVQIPIRNLSTNTYTSFDTTFTIAGNYFDNLFPHLSITHGGIDNGNYSVEWRNVKVELQDKEYYGIKEVQLPNGSVVNRGDDLPPLTESGTYRYVITDTNNVKITKDIQVNIDKVKPSLQITGDFDDKTQESMMIQVKATDDASGIQYVRMPNGQNNPQSSFSYRITQNGHYSFTAYDKAGNAYTKTVTISNLDETPPTLAIAGNPTAWTNDGVTLVVSAGDSGSGIDYVMQPNGSTTSQGQTSYTISENGTYTFKAVDKLGHTTTKSVTVSKIDKEKPSAPVIKGSEGWSNVDSFLTQLVDGVSTLSPVKRTEYRLTGATTKGWTTYTSPIVITHQGETNIIARTIDEAGNVSDERRATVKLDRESPVNTGIIIHKK